MSIIHILTRTWQRENPFMSTHPDKMTRQSFVKETFGFVNLSTSFCPAGSSFFNVIWYPS
jgi:hypothetical protein